MASTDMQIAERPSVYQTFLARPLSASLPISRELAIYLGIALLAGVLRFWDLGSRMLHHDESLHAVFSHYLYTGRGYQHDPLMHGPLQFHMIALMYFLFGATDATARFYHAGLGTILVFLPFYFRRYLGQTGAIITALLLALSPTFLYFSRFAREDIPMPVWSMLLVLATFRYLEERRRFHLILASVAVVLQFMTKESAYLNVTMLGIFLFALTLREDPRQWLTLLRPPVRLTAAGDLLWLLFTLTLPLGTALFVRGVETVRHQTMPYSTMGVFFIVVLCVSIALGMRWNDRLWVRAALVFWGIYIVFFTTLFTNPVGFATGTVGSLLYWMDQQGVARGNQPWYYYFVLLPLYDYVPLLFGLGGVVYWLTRRTRDLFAVFLIAWAFLSLAIYAWTSEKMPWLVIHLSLPFVLLAGKTLGRLVDVIDWRAVVEQRAIQTMAALVLAVLAAGAFLARGTPTLRGTMDLADQQELFNGVGHLVLFLIVAGFAVHFSRQLSGRVFLQMSTIALFVLLMPFSIRTAFQASYYNGDVPVEMIVYTQTSPDVGKVMREIDRLVYRTGATKDSFQVVYDSGVSWPFEWYLRDYKSKVFIGTGSNVPADAPVVLVGLENNGEARMREALGNRYVSQRYRLRWWFPEDGYRSLTVSKIFTDLLDPGARARLWRYLIFREPWGELGSTDFLMYVRRDLAGDAWFVPQMAEQRVEDAVYQAQTRTIRPILSIEQAGDAGALVQPKGVAVGPGGDVYVVDSQTHQVSRFDATGRHLATWGSQGGAPGQFNEPWGIAVDAQGNVYVADTWNHRVQKFDANGQLLTTWGSPNLEPSTRAGEFYGPRGIAVDAQGNVYVTDTGNHRVQKFDANGQLLGVVGTRGADDESFNEPVGIAVDADGNVLVADTWNQRVKKLDSNLAFIRQWPVVGWESSSIVNKPYLAVDAEGNVYTVDPENDRAIKFSSTGEVQAVWGELETAADSLRLPTGIAVDGEGNVWVTDSQHHRLLKFAPVR